MSRRRQSIRSFESVDFLRTLFEVGHGLTLLARLRVLECLEVLYLTFLWCRHFLPYEVLLDDANFFVSEILTASAPISLTLSRTSWATKAAIHIVALQGKRYVTAARSVYLHVVARDDKLRRVINACIKRLHFIWRVCVHSAQNCFHFGAFWFAQIRERSNQLVSLIFYLVISLVP